MANNVPSCLSPETLLQIGHNEVPPDELPSIEEHITNCRRCSDLFDNDYSSAQWRDEIQPALQETCLSETRRVDDEVASQSEILKLLGPTDDPAMLGRIGSYEIVGVIGQGGMGAVFKGFDRSLHRFVAIKMLLPHLASSGAARKRFAREGQAVAAVVDDHVMAIHGVDQWQGIPYLVMTYSRGVSLQKRLSDNGPLEVREILRIGMQTAKGLAAAHAQGIVHRDIKPANIFLDQSVERVQLMDFGLARAVDDASLTRSGTLAGTPQYMSPEQARAETVDHRSDLFSLGSVLYAMCVGHAPFRAESSYSVLRLITDKLPRPIRELNSDIPEWLCVIVSKLMSKQAEDRFESAEQVAELLEDCLAHVQQPATVPLPHSVIATTHAANRSRRPPMEKFIAAAGFAFVMLFAGALIVPQLNKSADESAVDAQARAKGKQIATVLGKPIYEGDLNKNVGDKDNLVRLLFEPLMEHYCKQQGIDRDAELKAKIKDEPSRVAARMFVLRAELNRHLYEKYGGRVQLTAFGPVAFDGQIKWIEDRKKAGDFAFTDAVMQDKFDKLWVQEPKDAIFASPSQIKEAFDPAITERFIDNFAKIPAGAFMNPALKLIGVVAGSPVYLREQAFNDPDLPLVLHQVIVWPLEKHYLNKHPEVAPTDAEIDAFTAQREKQDAETKADYQRGIDELNRQMEDLEADSDELLELQARQRVMEYKLKITGGRAAAAALAVPIKFQKHLYDNYGGGRGLMTPMGIDAFDAQRKWVEERERLGEFQIADPKLRETFYEYWNNGKERFGVGFIDDLSQVKGNFTLPWLTKPAGIPAPIKQGDANLPPGRKHVVSIDGINKSLAELSTSVRHDFASDALPRERFAVRGDDVSELVAAPSDGLHVTHRGKGGYSNTYVETLMRVHGNFEVTVSFKDFTIEPGENGSGGISLTAILENDVHTHGTVHRGATIDFVNPIWNFVQGEFVHSPQRDPGVVWVGATTEEATSGRLRLARVGETLYCLFAAGDAPEFRLIHAEQVGPESLLFGGIRLTTGVQSNGRTHGTTSVIWKELTIRAERMISDWTSEDVGGGRERTERSADK